MGYQLRLTGILAAIAIASPVGAQSIDEITVTARKKEENLQEIPIAIQALSADEIRRKSIDDLSDLTENVAGLVFDQGITAQDTRVVIRGLSPTRGRQNIAFLEDGIDISSESISTNGGSLLVNPRYLDFERIEVVKGPQSALYGRAAFNGAINYVTRDPGDEFEFDISANTSTAAGSENNTYSTKIAAGGPITDEFGLRASAAYWNEDGYYNNVVTAPENLGGGDGFGLSLKGLWKPRDNLRIEGRIGYSDDNYEQRPGAFVDYNSIIFYPEEALTAQWVVQEFFGGDPDDFRNYGYEVCGLRYDEAGGAMAGIENTETAATACAQDARNQVINGVPPGENELTELADTRVKNPLVSAPVATFTGQVPDGDQLQVRISPDQATIDPNGVNLPSDLPGTQIEVLRGTLNLQWDLTGGNIQAWVGYTDAKQRALFDFDKFAAAPDSIFGAVFQSPTGPGPDRMLGTADDIPCSLSGGDCSWGTSFVDFYTETRQDSLEIRYASERESALNFTIGGLYWQEKIDQLERGTDAFASDGAFPFLGAAFRDAMGGTIPNCYSPAAGPLPGVGMQAFMPDWVQVLTPTDISFLQNALQGPEDVSIPNGSNLLCPPSSSDILQYLDERAIIQPRSFEADTEHWSIYGMLEFDLNETWKLSLEGRYTSEREEQFQPVLDESILDPDSPLFNPRLSPSLIQPNCGQSPLSPMPSMDICTVTFLSGDAVTGGWTTPDTLTTIVPGVNQVSVRSTYFTPRAALEWRPVDKQMYYLSYAVGKKPGGFSRVGSGSGGFSADEAQFEEEKLEVYELGAKTTLFKDRLLFNAAVFYQDFTDKQVPISTVNRFGLPAPAVENAGKAEITGLEIEMTWAATERLELGLAYSYLDTEYKDFLLDTSSSNLLTRNSFEPLETNDPNLAGGGYFIGNSCTNVSARSTVDASFEPDVELLCAVDLSGNELEDAPKHALNLNAIYRAPFFTAGLEWYVETDFFYQDERFLEQSNSHYLDAYYLVDTRFGLLGDRWESVFYVDNLFDDDTVRSAQTAPGLATGNFINGPPRVREAVIAYPAPPRVFGLQLNYRFGE